MTKYSKDEIENARKNLKNLLRPGDTVYTILRHVSRSGMYRSISLFVIKKGEHRDITYWASRVLEDRIDAHGGIATTGCGMDMGFSVVYALSSRLFRDDTKTKARIQKHLDAKTKSYPWSMVRRDSENREIVAECGYWLIQSWA